MALIQISDLTFCYPGALQPVFEHVTLELDSGWHLGLIGRNGRGKTTFLNLLLGKLTGEGRIASPVAFEYFPAILQGGLQAPALSVARRIIAPFDEWEAEMERLAGRADEESLAAYGEIQEQYEAADGYIIDELIAAEAGRLGMAPEVLAHPYATLSGGEQVKLQLAALFLKKHRLLLIDEPTDHLDAKGRAAVAAWLKTKGGFILVSHDRDFIDGCVDHILSINRADIELQRGNYTSWRQNRLLQDEFEKAENRKLEASIRNLKEAAKRTERWSDKIEKSKKGGRSVQYNGGPPSVDKGYIGHQAARMMQRSKAIDRRREREIDQQQQLLKNIEETEPVKFLSLAADKRELLRAEGLALGFGGRTLFEGLGFSIQAGERVCIRGANGSGKSSLLALLAGELAPTAGRVYRQSGLVISTLPQNCDGLAGPLRDYAEQKDLPLPLFLAVLRKLDFPREAFDTPMERYSAGQKKKVCIAASLSKPAHLFLWDEPLNYIDLPSREQLEAAVRESGPTLVFVEHDAAFVRSAATRVIAL